MWQQRACNGRELFSLLGRPKCGFEGTANVILIGRLLFGCVNRCCSFPLRTFCWRAFQLIQSDLYSLQSIKNLFSLCRIGT